MDMGERGEFRAEFERNGPPPEPRASGRGMTARSWASRVPASPVPGRAACLPDRGEGGARAPVSAASCAGVARARPRRHRPSPQRHRHAQQRRRSQCSRARASAGAPTIPDALRRPADGERCPSCAGGRPAGRRGRHPQPPLACGLARAHWFAVESSLRRRTASWWRAATASARLRRADLMSRSLGILRRRIARDRDHGIGTALTAGRWRSADAGAERRLALSPSNHRPARLREGGSGCTGFRRLERSSRNFARLAALRASLKSPTTSVTVPSRPCRASGRPSRR